MPARGSWAWNALPWLEGLPESYIKVAVMVVVRHVSVETDQIEQALRDEVPSHVPAIEGLIQDPSRETPNNAKRIVLCGVDPCQRLSGISLKLLAYERFLAEYPLSLIHI